jgi:hypothetical protein
MGFFLGKQGICVMGKRLRAALLVDNPSIAVNGFARSA